MFAIIIIINTEPFQPLEGRWPNDKILLKEQSGWQLVANILRTPAGQNYYQDDLSLDEQDSSFITSFATKNNLNYSPNSDILPGQYGKRPPGWLGFQSKATQPMFAHQITGTLYGYSVKFCLAYAPTDNQRAKSTRAYDHAVQSISLTRKSIIRITLPKAFPQMVLDSNKNDKSYISTISSSFKESQKLSLEGNFAQYFDFYSPPGLQVNTLTVLAPNFMQILIDSASTFDVEFYGKELILVTKDPIYTPSIMSTALSALEAQLQYMNRLLPSWSYLPDNPPFDLLQKTYFDGRVIKVGPLRVKPATMLIIILLGFVLYGLLIIPLNN